MKASERKNLPRRKIYMNNLPLENHSIGGITSFFDWVWLEPPTTLVSITNDNLSYWKTKGQELELAKLDYMYDGIIQLLQLYNISKSRFSLV